MVVQDLEHVVVQRPRFLVLVRGRYGKDFEDACRLRGGIGFDRILRIDSVHGVGKSSDGKLLFEFRHLSSLGRFGGLGRLPGNVRRSCSRLVAAHRRSNGKECHEGGKHVMTSEPVPLVGLAVRADLRFLGYFGSAGTAFFRVLHRLRREMVSPPCECGGSSFDTMQEPRSVK